jgi:hypothetical protein
VIYYQTGTDTSDTDVELTTAEGKKVRWKQATFNQVADLRMDHFRVCEPKRGVRERVEAREKYERSNAAELATYRRLKAKYEQGNPSE